MHEGQRFRVVFFGTPEFALPTLRALLDGPDAVVGAVCQADRPVGRDQRVQMPPVKSLARSRDIPVLQPTRLRAADTLATLRAWAPDLVAVAAYGRILPEDILELPSHGCINVHASLLPKYRGAAPIQWAILRGEHTTGVTIMRMNERMDEGAILLQRKIAIMEEETHGQLQERLARLGSRALMEALAQLESGTLRGQPQDDAIATLAPMIHKADGAIDWTRSAEEIVRKIRAFNPWPSAYTWWEGKVLKIYRARVRPETANAEPGTVIAIGDKIGVATGSDVLAISELQREGRKRLPAGAFARGGALAVGVRLGKGPVSS